MITEREKRELISYIERIPTTNENTTNTIDNPVSDNRITTTNQYGTETTERTTNGYNG